MSRLGAEVSTYIIVKSSPAVQAFLIYKNRTLDEYAKFIIQIIDETRLLVDEDRADEIKQFVRDFHNDIVYESTAAVKARTSKRGKKRRL